MPKKLENALKKSAEKHGFAPGSKRYDAYVYGTLARMKKEGKIDS